MRNPILFVRSVLLLSLFTATVAFAQTPKPLPPAAAPTPAAPPAAQTPEPTPAAAPDDPALDFAIAQVGRALFLRCLCTGDTLEFQAAGHLEDPKKTHPVDWTVAGVNVTKAERKGPETFVLEGTRAAVLWNDDAKEFSRRGLKNEPIHIVINGASTEQELRRTMGAIFSVGIDLSLQLSMPPFWQHYFDPKTAWPEDGIKAADLYTPGGKVNGVTVPAANAVSKPNPEFTQEALHDKITGPAILRLVVDANGDPRRVAVFQPLGYGLDAKAVAAIEKAKFAPVTLAGKHVATNLLIRQDFNVAVIQAGVVQ